MGLTGAGGGTGGIILPPPGGSGGGGGGFFPLDIGGGGGGGPFTLADVSDYIFLPFVLREPLSNELRSPPLPEHLFAHGPIFRVDIILNIIIYNIVFRY